MFLNWSLCPWPWLGWKGKRKGDETPAEGKGREGRDRGIGRQGERGRGFLPGEEQVPEDMGRGSPLLKAGESESWGCPSEMKLDLPQALVCAGVGERRTVQACGSQLWGCGRTMRGRGAKQT